MQHALRAELRDERRPLGVGELQLGELVEDRLGEFGPAEVDEPEDGLEVVGGRLAREFERGADGGIGFERRSDVGGFGWRGSCAAAARRQRAAAEVVRSVANEHRE